MEGEIKKPKATQKRMKQILCCEILKTCKFIVDAQVKGIVGTKYLLGKKPHIFVLYTYEKADSSSICVLKLGDLQLGKPK